MPATVTLDLARAIPQLHEPLPRAEIDAYAASVDGRVRSRATAAAHSAVMGTLGYITLLAAIFSLPILLAAGAIQSIASGVPDIVLAGVIGLLAVLAFATLVWFTVGIRVGRRIVAEWRVARTWRHRALLARAAAAAGLEYQSDPDGLPRVTTFVAARPGRYLDTFVRGGLMIANWRSDDSHRSPGGWGVITLPLERRVPHLLLMPRHGGLRAEAPAPFIGARAMYLEGDFTKDFILYVPQGYERDALYIFTPDVMALLVDTLRHASFEIYDDRIAITTPRPFAFESDATWATIQNVLAVLTPKLARSTGRYADDRSPEIGLIAAPARRLRSGVPWVIWAFAATGALTLAAVVFTLLFLD